MSGDNSSPTRLRRFLTIAVGALLFGTPAASAASEITDLEGLVQHLESNSESVINLSELTTLNVIAPSTDPDRASLAKTVSANFTGSLDGGGIKVQISGSPLFSHLSGAKIENLTVTGEIISPTSSSIGALAGSASSSEFSNVKAENVVIQNASSETGILIGTSSGSVFKDIEVKTSEVAGTANIGGIIGISNHDQLDRISVTGVTIQSSIPNDGVNIGGVIGQAIHSSLNDVKIEKSAAIGFSNIGGIVGAADNSKLDAVQASEISVTASASNSGGITGYAYASEIENVTIKEAVISSPVQTGGISGQNYASQISQAEVKDSRVEGILDDSSHMNGVNIGGVVGLVSEGTTSNVRVADVVISGTNNVGGVAGSAGNNATISNAVAQVEVIGSNRVGGIAGETGSSILNSFSVGQVIGVNERIGGLVGNQTSENSFVENSYFSGNVRGSNEVGGLIGRAEGSVSNSASSANVQGETRVGGLVGAWQTNYSNMSNSHLYASGNVTGSSKVGGLVGSLQQRAESECISWVFYWWFPSCIESVIQEKYISLSDAAVSSSVSGLHEVGALIGAVETGGYSASISIFQHATAASEVYVNDVQISSDSENFVFGSNPSRISLVDVLDPEVRAEHTRKRAKAVKASQSLQFLNSDPEIGGVFVYSNWPDLEADELGLWGQCNSGELPYLKSIAKSDPCSYDLSTDSESTLEKAGVSLLVGVKEIRQGAGSPTNETAMILSKLTLSGVNLTPELLKVSGIQNLTPRLSEYLSTLNNYQGPSTRSAFENLTKKIEAELIEAHFFDPKFQPNAKTFELFGVFGVSERLVPDLLKSLRSLPEDKRNNLNFVIRAMHQELILTLINDPTMAVKISPELLIKAGVVAPESPHAKLVARQIKKVPANQLDSIEKLASVVAAIKQKADQRIEKLRARSIAFAR